MRARWLVWLFPAFCVAVALWWDHGGQGWAAVQTGTRCGSTGVRYCYWSGFGSVWPWSLAVIASAGSAFALLWRTHTCDKHWWCWRKPDHPLEGNEHFRLCRVHSPDDHMTIHEAIEHHLHLKRKREDDASRA